MENHRVCPWWIGYLLLIPFRKLQHNPRNILGPHVKKGMQVMDYGCAMGYFSIPMAKMTGEKGAVYCVDIQEKMLSRLQRRAIKHDVSGTIRTLQVGGNFSPNNLQSTLDFILLFMVAHEVPDQATLFNDLYNMLKPGGKVLFCEPKGHVTVYDFEKSIQWAKNAGFKITKDLAESKGLSVILAKD